MYDWLDRAVLAAPGTVAIERQAATGPGSPERVTYAELAAEAAAHAAAMRTAGIAPGDRVPIDDEDRLRFAARLHGGLLHGAAVVPIDRRLPESEQARRRQPGRAWGPGVATIMYTSGTTSEPKPVELTLENWWANATGSALALGLDRAERWLCVMPLVHVGGLSILLRSAAYGTTVVVHEGFDTGAVLGALAEPDPARAITLVSLVPTMLARLLDAGLTAPPALRWALLGGGPIPPGLLDRAAAAGVPVAPTFGMTEGCSQIATFGVPLAGVQLSLTAAGELLVRGPNVASGSLAPDGWLHTGDIARFDGRGRLVIVGRASDTIVTGGENVAPAEVEAILLGHPAVADAGVYGVADPEWGEAIVARIVQRPGALLTAEDLSEYCRARMARYQVPKRFELADELPRTISGKLLRRELSRSSMSHQMPL